MWHVYAGGVLATLISPSQLPGEQRSLKVSCELSCIDLSVKQSWPTLHIFWLTIQYNRNTLSNSNLWLDLAVAYPHVCAVVSAQICPLKYKKLITQSSWCWDWSIPWEMGPLQWHHVSGWNLWQLDCLCNSAFRLTWKKTLKPASLALCAAVQTGYPLGKQPAMRKSFHVMTSSCNILAVW